MRIFENLAELASCVGEEIAVSDWIEVTQERIDAFAQATGDHQWIHVDRERAATGPFGTTIAHGYLTLSLLPMLMESAIELRGVRMSVNYGLNRVRFPAPVPAGSRVRARFRVASVEDIGNGGLQIVTEATIEREGGDKPVCIAETVARRYGPGAAVS